MMINLTIVVQAVNFFVAYLMIKKLLLQPAVARIYEEDRAYHQAVEKIARQKEKIALQEKRIEERLHAFKKTFLEHEPEVMRAEEVAITIVPGMPELPAIDEKMVKQIAQEIVDQLTEKVAHVH